jgi:hypothetical protein
MRPMIKTGFLPYLLLVAAAVVLAGCGGSSSSTTAATTISAGQLRAAKKAGEEKARETDRVNNLQKELHSLRRQIKHRGRAPEESQTPSESPSPSTSPAVESSAPLRTFHAPSGNVSCEIFTTGATCTVESVGETFAFSSGEAARIEPGDDLPRSLGERVGYGATVSSGSISCEVPPSDVPRGVSCVDSSSGHGFDASRIPERQEAY